MICNTQHEELTTTTTSFFPKCEQQFILAGWKCDRQFYLPEGLLAWLEAVNHSVRYAPSLAKGGY